LEDAIVLVAIKGEPVDAAAVPERTSELWRTARIPERQRSERHPSQRLFANTPVLNRLSRRRFWRSTLRRR
jgi:hypothetical protein